MNFYLNKKNINIKLKSLQKLVKYHQNKTIKDNFKKVRVTRKQYSFLYSTQKSYVKKVISYKFG